MAWDTAGTERRLLDAAVDEFAARGPDGARIDRIAMSSGVNKERIYRYFGSKQKLFEAVLEAELAKLAAAVPLTRDQARDLGDYAGRVFDHHLAHPHLLRLMSWEALHDGGQAAIAEEARAAHYADKIAAVAAAQEAGAIRSEVPAAYLFSAVMAMTTWWFTSPQVARMITPAAVDDTPPPRRAMLIAMVAQLTTPNTAMPATYRIQNPAT